MLISKTTKTKWTYNNKELYVSKGYIFTKYFQELEVNVEDLPRGSDAKVEIICDYCFEDGVNTIIIRPYGDHIKKREQSVIKKDCCKKCWHKKKSETCIMMHGVDSFSQLPEVKKKISSSQSHGYEFVKSQFESRGFLLLTEYYINNEQKLEFICLSHPKRGSQYTTYAGLTTVANACRECESIVVAAHFRHNYEFVKSKFEEKSLILLDEVYINEKTNMNFICTLHPSTPQVTTFASLYHNDAGCYYCGLERRSGENHYKWKGGISPLSNHLREKIEQWKQDSIKNSNYRCVVTGERFDDIHHLYSFNDIMIETVDELGLPLKEKINDYTSEELTNIENKCIEIHYRYPLGVCLTHEVHDLFHSIYRYGKNTPEQFYEFKEDYKNGKYNKSA